MQLEAHPEVSRYGSRAQDALPERAVEARLAEGFDRRDVPRAGEGLHRKGDCCG